MIKKDSLFSFVDLFSGIGGFKIALENNNGKCLGFSEINNDAITTYCENFDENRDKNFGNITEVKELPQHDLLTAGVPCQSWSIAGKNLGFDDDRGQLWNDTIYLLQQSQPKAFIFENVKGLVDPRNKEALSYILDRIKKAGYHAKHYVINSQEYGVPQSRVRVYIVGFREKTFFDKFELPACPETQLSLAEILKIKTASKNRVNKKTQQSLFGEKLLPKSTSLSSKNGVNDYFLFNDLRNGQTTIHSWDLIKTTERQKEICYILLKNRRKSLYGIFDGNPLSLDHFQKIDPTISEEELHQLIQLEILKQEEYRYLVKQYEEAELSEEEKEVLSYKKQQELLIDNLKASRKLKLKKISLLKVIASLKEKNILCCNEVRYDFKNTKISTGLFGINRVFLPRSEVFPTLVASDTNDYIATEDVSPTGKEDYKKRFLEDVYKKKKYRKITKREACLIQGFPEEFILPESRARWMKLIGNSVSVPVINSLCQAIVGTGVFDS